ncbi:unnamed protein product [Prunus brigantina]
MFFPKQLLILGCFICQFCQISKQHPIKSLSQRYFEGSLGHLDEMSFFHRDPTLHLEFPEPGYEILSRFILTLFEGSKITDGDFWLNPVVVVVENTFHLLPSLDRIWWQTGVPSGGNGLGSILLGL